MRGCATGCMPPCGRGEAGAAFGGGFRGAAFGGGIPRFGTGVVRGNGGNVVRGKPMSWSRGVLPVLFAVSGLAGCAEESGGMRDGVDRIEISTGTPFTRKIVFTIRADDRVDLRSWGGAAETLERSDRLEPGTFERISAILATEGPVAAAGLPQDGAICMDYGQDRIIADPAIGRFSEIETACPHQPLLDLIGRLLAEVEGGRIE